MVGDEEIVHQFDVCQQVVERSTERIGQVRFLRLQVEGKTDVANGIFCPFVLACDAVDGVAGNVVGAF